MSEMQVLLIKYKKNDGGFRSSNSTEEIASAVVGVVCLCTKNMCKGGGIINYKGG